MMYEFARGPLVWIAFAVFIFGSLGKVIWVILYSKQDKVVHPYMRWRFGLRSLVHWVLPFGSRNMRLRPAFTVLSYLFHACLILTPIFALGHVVMWREAWGINLWYLPEDMTHVMTIVVVVTLVIFLLRRIADPAVRYVSTPGDFFLIAVVGAPFVTGLLAYYQAFDYKTVLTIHMWAGALWLMAIPFTRIVHMVFFPFTRAYMGCEFGYVRHSRDW